MQVLRIISRSSKSRFKIDEQGKRYIFSSICSWKENDSNSELNPLEEKKTAKKKTLMKWNSINLALFGPIIKEKKTKKNSQPQTIENQETSNELQKPDRVLPINLWNSDKVEVNLGRKGIHKVKKTKLKNSITNICNKEYKVKEPKLPIQVKQETNHNKAEEPKESKDPSILKDADRANKEPIQREQKSPLLELKLTKYSTEGFNNNSTQSLRFSTIPSVLPSTPFFVQDNIIFPFPMVLKRKTNNSPTEIVTIASLKADVPSVTQVLNKTMSEKSEMMLALWRKRKIAEVGEDGLKDFMRESKLTGKELHTGIETYLRGVEYSSIRIEPRIAGHWLSMKSILPSISDVHVLESYVVHPYLRYKGFVDCVARYQNNLVVIEWKTSQRTKSTLEEAYDDPVQIAAYVGALNADEKYSFEVENAILVVAYPTGRPADVLKLNKAMCEHYWNQWLKRLEAFNHLKSMASCS